MVHTTPPTSLDTILARTILMLRPAQRRCHLSRTSSFPPRPPISPALVTAELFQWSHSPTCPRARLKLPCMGLVVPHRHMSTRPGCLSIPRSRNTRTLRPAPQSLIGARRYGRRNLKPYSVTQILGSTAHSPPVHIAEGTASQNANRRSKTRCRMLNQTSNTSRTNHTSSNLHIHTHPISIHPIINQCHRGSDNAPEGDAPRFVVQVGSPGDLRHLHSLYGAFNVIFIVNVG